ncbi:hypothetical protein [Streptomyces violascens]|uniref:hypothetical protein n=1 Tax=Streptomyces violascens TaxID=67381 RepID=UPI00365BDDCA
MRVTQEQQAERRPGTPAGGTARRESALARLHRTAGNAAMAQLFAPTAEQGREPASIQRITDHPGGSYDAAPQPGEGGPYFVAQGPEPVVAMGGGGEPRDIRERLRYELAEARPADAPLRVADVGTLAVHGLDESKEFHAVRAALVTDPEVKRTKGKPRIRPQKDFEDHTCRSWFFRVYGGGPGESFHEQQAASGFFNNPMTLRVGRPPAGPDAAAQ